VWRYWRDLHLAVLVEHQLLTDTERHATAAYTQGDSDVISIYIYASVGFRRHFVGKTLKNVSYCDIA